MTRVFVYKNLHRSSPGRPVYSVRDCRTGRVVKHAERVLLRDVELVVQPAGRARVLATGRKNVHAGLRGELVGYGRRPIPCAWSVTYDPKRWATFVNRCDGAPVHGATLAHAGPLGVNVQRPDPYAAPPADD